MRQHARVGRGALISSPLGTTSLSKKVFLVDFKLCGSETHSASPPPPMNFI